MEFYHKESYGGDYATVGVQVPALANSVNPVKEIQTMAITCPTTNQKVKFTITSATGGNWKIKFQFEDIDGRPIGNTLLTSSIAYDATAADLQAILLSRGYTTTVVLTTTASSREWEVEFVTRLVTPTSIGNVGVECVDILPSATNCASPSISQRVSTALSGSFTLQGLSKTVDIKYDASASAVESALRGLGYKSPITVRRSGQVYNGATWVIEFSVEDGDVAQLASPSATFAGCTSTPSIAVSTTRPFDNTKAFYESIPYHLLMTADSVSQITV
jgi:hypothetical protein